MCLKTCLFYIIGGIGMGMTVSLYLSDDEVERLSKQVGSTQAKDISKFLKKLLLGKLKLQELNLAKLNQDILQE
jgi:hypothetical protein